MNKYNNISQKKWTFWDSILQTIWQPLPNDINRL